MRLHPGDGSLARRTHRASVTRLVTVIYKREQQQHELESCSDTVGAVRASDSETGGTRQLGAVFKLALNLGKSANPGKMLLG